MLDKPKFTLGIYEHYKGIKYMAIDLVMNSNTDEWEVLYINHKGHQFTRTLKTFFDQLHSSYQRFKLLEAL